MPRFSALHFSVVQDLRRVGFGTTAAIAALCWLVERGACIFGITAAVSLRFRWFCGEMGVRITAAIAALCWLVERWGVYFWDYGCNRCVLLISGMIFLKDVILMNLTCHYPQRTGDTASDCRALFDWAAALLDELRPLLCNLDAGNVTEAACVKAQNIDTNTARISQAQIGALSADKLTSGSIDAGVIQVKNLSADEIKSGTLRLSQGMGIEGADGRLSIDPKGMRMYDAQGKPGILMGQDSRGKFYFSILNDRGDEGLTLDEKGNLRVENCVYFNAESRQYRGAGLRFVNENGEVVRQMMVGEDGVIDFWGNNDLPNQVHRLRVNGRSLATVDELEALEKRVQALEAQA